MMNSFSVIRGRRPVVARNMFPASDRRIMQVTGVVGDERAAFDNLLEDVRELFMVKSSSSSISTSDRRNPSCR